jgi:hypothetical protein
VDGSRQVLPDGTTLADAREILNVGEEFIEFIEFLDSIRTRIQQSGAHLPEIAKFELPPLVMDIIHEPSLRQSSPLARRIQYCTRMACLICLCAAVIEYESSQAATSEFIEGLQKEVFQRVQRHYVCSEELLYLLFKGVERLEVQTPHRGWQVSRLMSVAKKLSERSWQRVYQHLLLVLGIADDAWDDNSEVLRGNTDALRQEICGQLYPLWTALQQT